MIEIFDQREALSEPNAFSIWDTVRHQFVCIGGKKCFLGESDLRECYANDPGNRLDLIPRKKRVIGLLPDWAKES